MRADEQDVFPSDVAFTLFLASFSPQRFNDYEYRIFQQFQVARARNEIGKHYRPRFARPLNKKAS